MHVGYRAPLLDVPYSKENVTLYYETLTMHPRLFLVRNFLTTEEADWILNQSYTGLNRAKVLEANGSVPHKSRTGSSTWLYKKDGDIIRRVDRRCGVLVKIPPEFRREEAMQIVHYLPGQFYYSHNDWFGRTTHKANANVAAGVNRIVTVFFYLNDVEEGGQTIFPYGGTNGYKLGDRVDFTDCTRGTPVYPRKGDAVFWYSLTARGQYEGEGDVYSLHGACPPHSGEKFAANKWIYNRVKVEGAFTYTTATEDEL